MKQLTLQPGVFLTLAALAMPFCADGQRDSASLLASGTVSGIIRDSEGVPQMGALVEAFLPDSTLGASAVTDARGRYRFALRPGSYRVRATAALAMPAVRERLQLGRGTRAVVDLTLATLLAPSGWLPVSRRTPAEPSDDWAWTLRSSASRPILRYGSSDDDTGFSPVGGDGPLVVSSSRQESRRGASGGRMTVGDSEGSFARGGNHNTILLTRVNEDGSASVLRADLSGSRSPYPVAPSAEVTVGMQRKMPGSGYSRAVLSYSAHPELTDGRNTGMHGATLRTAHRIDLGDTFRIDAGSVMRDSNLTGNAFIVEPFLRLAAQPGAGVVLAYTMTAARGTESIEDLDRVQAALPVAVMRNSHLQLEHGRHHALSAAGKLPGGGTLEAAVYHDRLQNPLISGIGAFTPTDLQTNGIVADPTTRTYRIAGPDYDSTGFRVALRQPVTKSLTIGVEGGSGHALRVGRLQQTALQDLLRSVNPNRIYTGTAFLDGKVLRTGTTVHASYRWQPERSLTAVDTFRVGEEGGYISCSLRQSLGRTRFLPQGLEAVVDLENLLAQGYQPFLSSDGQTLYLAQTPRSLQAGLSFSF